MLHQHRLRLREFWVSGLGFRGCLFESRVLGLGLELSGARGPG